MLSLKKSSAALLAVAGVLGFGVVSASAAVHDEGNPEVDWEVTSSTLGDSVSAYDRERAITEYDLDRAVEVLGGGEPEEEKVIVLEADILFSSNEWELSSTAGNRIAELVEEIPEGATVQVHGHTDSLPVDESRFDFDNQELSENRAEAVADVLSDERSDLSLDVEGFGDSEPAVTEDEEDPSTFAANRRVEIRYD